MKKNVAHFVRKSTQFRASFIQNQFLNHIDFTPVGIFKYESNINDGGFANFSYNNFNILDLWKNSNTLSRVLFTSLKLISKQDKSLIEKFIKMNDVRILHFHYGTDAGIYYPFLKYNNIPSVVSFYGYDVSTFPNFFWGYGRIYLKNRVFKFVNKVLAMTEEMKKDLINIGCPEEKIIVHYHGIPTKKFYVERNYRKKNKKIIFLMIASLNPVKGHLFVFKALRKIVRKGFKDFELRIIGDGESWYKDKLKDYIKKYALSNHVVFLGAYSYGSKEILDELRKAHVFIHPSVTTEENKNSILGKEGVPGAIVEAMASGLPVISTYHGGIPFVIRDKETGILVSEWDVNALVEAIIDLSRSEKKRKIIGLSGQDYAKNNLDLVEKEKELEEIYMSLVEN